MIECTNCALRGRHVPSTVDVVEKHTCQVVGYLCDECSQDVEEGFAIQPRLFSDMCHKVIAIDSRARSKPSARPIKLSAYSQGAADMVDAMTEAITAMSNAGKLTLEGAQHIQVLRTMTKFTFAAKLDEYRARQRQRV